MPFIGVEDLLKHFQRHKVPMAVATSSSKSSFHMKTSHLQDYFSVFQHVVTGASDPAVKHGKPAPDIFNVCVSRFPDYSFQTQVNMRVLAPHAARSTFEISYTICR